MREFKCGKLTAYVSDYALANYFSSIVDANDKCVKISNDGHGDRFVYFYQLPGMCGIVVVQQVVVFADDEEHKREIWNIVKQIAEAAHFTYIQWTNTDEYSYNHICKPVLEFRNERSNNNCAVYLYKTDYISHDDDED